MPEEGRGLPLVGKCCAMDEVFAKNAKGKSMCLSSWNESSTVFSPLFSDFNQSGVLVPGDEKEKFVAVVGIPCRYRKYVSRNRTGDLYIRIRKRICIASDQSFES